MIEGSPDQISEEKFVEALAFGHKAIQPVIAAIKDTPEARRQTMATFKPRRNARGPRPPPPSSSEFVPAERVSAAIFGFRKNIRTTNVKALKEEAQADARIAENEGGRQLPKSN